MARDVDSEENVENQVLVNLVKWLLDEWDGMVSAAEEHNHSMSGRSVVIYVFVEVSGGCRRNRDFEPASTKTSKWWKAGWNICSRSHNLHLLGLVN